MISTPTTTTTAAAATGSGKPKKLPIHLKLIVGALAGAFGTTCIFPIDMVKTRLQSTGLGPAAIIQKILTSEGGIRGFYRGLGANLIGVIPEKSIKLASNEIIREFFEKEDGSIELQHEMIAGAGAGFIQVIATNPMEITKIRMQMQATLAQEERQTTLQVVKSLGVRGMYRGSAATLTRDVPYSLFFFPAYAHLKKHMADEQGNNTLFSLFSAGAGAGGVAAAAVTPADVIKTRLQVAGGKERYVNMPTAFKKIVAEEGASALFKGAFPRMIVVGPLFGITLLAFEAQKKYMIKHGLL